MLSSTCSVSESVDETRHQETVDAYKQEPGDADDEAGDARRRWLSVEGGDLVLDALKRQRLHGRH